jgi:uncharacterized protein (TIGR02145 family)
MKTLKLTLFLFLLCLAFATCKKDKGMPTVTDVDGNVYHTVKIGTQTWMVENLKTTHYRNGDAIPNEKNAQNWANLATGAYVDYDNVLANGEVYGRLYNWFAATDARNIAPQGWHVPSQAEYVTLVDYLGGEAVAGGKIKQTGTKHWASPNIGSNSSGFTAFPSGYYSINGNFYSLGSAFIVWTSTSQDLTYAWEYQLISGNNFNDDVFDKNSGAAIRCIKD